MKWRFGRKSRNFCIPRSHKSYFSGCLGSRETYWFNTCHNETLRFGGLKRFLTYMPLAAAQYIIVAQEGDRF